MKTFGQLLRKFRKQAKISNVEIAKHLGVSPAYVSIVESGKQPPFKFDKCLKVAKLLALKKGEKREFFKAALEGRASDELKLFIAYVRRLSG